LYHAEPGGQALPLDLFCRYGMRDIRTFTKESLMPKFSLGQVVMTRGIQEAIEQHPDDWKEKIRGLKNIDWSRENPEWEGRLLLNGQMVRLAKGIELAANTILQNCGIELSEDRLKYESK